MEIYQTHHERMFEVLAQSNEDSFQIAEKILAGEESRGKHPSDRLGFIAAIAGAIEAKRMNKDLPVLGIDFPDTGLKTDPVCKACRQCPTFLEKEDVEYLYSKKRR